MNIRNLTEFYDNFFSSSVQEKKGLAVLSQYLEQGYSDDSLVTQLISILQDCKNLNDLRFVVELLKVMKEAMVGASVNNIPKIQKVVEEAEQAMRRILAKHPKIVRQLLQMLDRED